MMARGIRNTGAVLTLLLAGCAAGTGAAGQGGGNQIVVNFDPSIPDLNAAMIVAQRDCSARGANAVLLSTQSAGARSATFTCDEIRRNTGGGNNSLN